MKSVWILAKNTYLEIIRDRILYGLIVFAVFIIGISLVLGKLSFSEQARISIDFGLTAIHLSAVALSIFVGSTLLLKEIDKKTIMTLLVRPVTRLDFLLGKAIGLVAVNAVSVLSLGLLLVIIFSTFGLELNATFFMALMGILMESMVLLALSMFFSCFSSSIMVAIFVISIYLLGHWIDSLYYFIGQHKTNFVAQIGEVIVSVVPNLENFNWRAHVVYGVDIPMSDIGMAFLYMLLWFSFLISGASLIIRNKDFG